MADEFGFLDFGSGALENDFDSNYGLLAPEQTVLIRAYSDDTDDMILTEIKPKFIVMFEPDMDFVRRVEASTLELCFFYPLYSSENTGLQKL